MPASAGMSPGMTTGAFVMPVDAGAEADDQPPTGHTAALAALFGATVGFSTALASIMWWLL